MSIFHITYGSSWLQMVSGSAELPLFILAWAMLSKLGAGLRISRAASTRYTSRRISSFLQYARVPGKYRRRRMQLLVPSFTTVAQ